MDIEELGHMSHLFCGSPHIYATQILYKISSRKSLNAYRQAGPADVGAHPLPQLLLYRKWKLFHFNARSLSGKRKKQFREAKLKFECQVMACGGVD